MASNTAGGTMGRYLVTTADETKWVPDRPVLLLGPWCLDASREHVWSIMDYAVFDPKFGVAELDNHFETMNLLFEDLLTDFSASRQQLPEVFRLSGCICIANLARFRAERTLFHEPVGLVEVDAAEAIDIGVPADLEVARSLVSKHTK